MKRFFSALIFVFLCILSGRTQTIILNDSTSYISVLTNSPSSAIHAMYGHTALRVVDSSQQIDLLFNYGIFDFNEKNFLFRFVKGETDYQLGIYPTGYALSEAAVVNYSIREQILNLTPEEKQQLVDLLMENYKPENRTYRYNFLFDNCSTRPYQLILKAIDKPIAVSDTTATSMTFRHIIRNATDAYPWVSFGIDLLLGSRIDKPITYNEELFLPAYLEKHLRKISITEDSNQTRQLIVDEHTLFEAENIDHPEKADTPISPILFFSIVLCIMSLLAFIDLYFQIHLWGINLFVFIGAGLVGAIIHFLLFCSEHPAVSPNLMGYLFHPYYLLLPIFLFIHNQKVGILFSIITTVPVLYFLIGAICKWQIVPGAIYPVAAIILINILLFWRYYFSRIENRKRAVHRSLEKRSNTKK